MKNIRLVIFLTVLVSISTLFLAGSELIYRKLSVVILEKKLYGVILELFAIEYNDENIYERFEENFEARTMGDNRFFISREGEVILFTTEGPGLWSRIELLLAVNPGGESLFGMRVMSQGETPGLGGRITEEGFQNSFSGVEVRPQIRVVKLAQNLNEVDAISGATKTSSAVEEILNKGIEHYDSFFGE